MTKRNVNSGNGGTTSNTGGGGSQSNANQGTSIKGSDNTHQSTKIVENRGTGPGNK